MQEVLGAYPGAQGALFARYHIGGCSSCGFQPTDTLEEVLRSHKVLDVQEAIEYIKRSQEEQDTLQIPPRKLAQLLHERKVTLLDVRSETEHRMVHLDGDQRATQELAQEILQQWPKDTLLVLYCHFGNDSLEAARHLMEQGFTNVKCLRGALMVGPKRSIPSYHGIRSRSDA
mgnify:CR=1 FL=1